MHCIYIVICLCVHKNIFNFSNDADLITQIIPEGYNLRKNGVQIDYSSPDVDSLVADIGYTMEPFTATSAYSTENEFLTKLVAALLIDEPEDTSVHYSLATREKYVENYQDKLSYSLGLFFKMPSSALAGMMQEIQNDPTFMISMMFYTGVNNPLYKLIKKYLDLYNVEYDETELENNLAPLIDQFVQQLIVNVSSFADLTTLMSPIQRTMQFHYPEVNYLLLKEYLGK